MTSGYFTCTKTPIFPNTLATGILAGIGATGREKPFLPDSWQTRETGTAKREDKKTAFYPFDLAEREGFEPSIRGYRIPDFESGAFDHSANFPNSELQAG